MSPFFFCLYPHKLILIVYIEHINTERKNLSEKLTKNNHSQINRSWIWGVSLSTRETQKDSKET